MVPPVTGDFLTVAESAKMCGYKGHRLEGTYYLPTPGKQKAEIVQETDYPESGKVRVTLHLDKPENMLISVRIPGWSIESTLSVNGENGTIDLRWPIKRARSSG